MRIPPLQGDDSLQASQKVRARPSPLGKIPERRLCFNTFTHRWLHPQSVEESGKRVRLLSPAWVIEEESGKWLAPILRNADELAASRVAVLRAHLIRKAAVNDVDGPVLSCSALLSFLNKVAIRLTQVAPICWGLFFSLFRVG